MCVTSTSSTTACSLSSLSLPLSLLSLSFSLSLSLSLSFFLSFFPSFLRWLVGCLASPCLCVASPPLPFCRSERLHAPSVRKTHHVGDYLPQTELEKFMAKATGQEDDYMKLDESNKGHQLLKKLGWEEGK